MLYFVVVRGALSQLSVDASVRLKMAFRPKTSQCYRMLFRTFVAFCIVMKISVFHVDCKCILSFMECLVKQQTSVHMLSNYISAIKAMFVMFHLDYKVLEDPKIKYFLKSVRINRPLTVPKCNIMDLKTLHKLVTLCNRTQMGLVFKAVFLTAFYGFLRLSNLAPHSRSMFDPSRHITAGDLIFSKRFVKIILKWSKTNQDRNRVQVLTLPKIKGSDLCPYRALRAIIALYAPTGNDPLFQINTLCGWQVLVDSRIRKFLKKMNVSLGFSPHHFTFHTFRRSGATLAFNSHVPNQQIKSHGAWTSECVWRYIQQDQAQGENIASALATVVNAT